MKISSNQIKRLTTDDVDQMGFPADVGLAIKSNLAVVTTLGEQIDLPEKRLQEDMNERPKYSLLTSVPGIGRILAPEIGSHESVQSPLDAKRHQRSSGAAKPPGRKQNTADCLILMGDWRDSFAAMS